MLRIIDVGEPLTFGTEDLDLTMILSQPKLPVSWWKRLFRYLYGLYKRQIVPRREDQYWWDRSSSFHYDVQLP